ncbi:MAG: hypothetical protein U0Q16_31430 [Bryobacteraceae bacterium]
MKCFAVAVAAALLAAGASQAALIYGTNAIVNGGAESGSGSADGNTGGTPVPGWTLTGNFLAIQWAAGGGFPINSDPGPSSRGTNFFAGGPSNAFSEATQSLLISNVSSDVDTGLVTFAVQGYFGGFDGQDDNAQLVVNFLDGSNAQIGTVSIGGVSSADRGGATGMLLRSGFGLIPAGTRTLFFDLRMTRTAGAYNDGYADELSFLTHAPDVGPSTAPSTPEPSSALLALPGAFLLFALSRRPFRANG